MKRRKNRVKEEKKKLKRNGKNSFQAKMHFECALSAAYDLKLWQNYIGLIRSNAMNCAKKKKLLQKIV